MAVSAEVKVVARRAFPSRATNRLGFATVDNRFQDHPHDDAYTALAWGLRVAGRKISDSRHSRDQWLLVRRAFGQAASYPSQVMSTCSTSQPLWVAVPVLLIAALVARNLPAFVAMFVSGYQV